MLNSITNWDVLEDSFAEKFIPKVHSYVFFDALNVASYPPSPIWTQENEMNDLEEEYNQIIEDLFESSHMAENENKISDLKEKDLNLSYTPYEYILNNKFENEIEDPPLNTQEDLILVIDDETSQENL